MADPRALIDGQRRIYLQHLSELDRLADRAAEDGGSPAAALLIEGAALHVQADIRWLDRCEELLVPRR